MSRYNARKIIISDIDRKSARKNVYKYRKSVIKNYTYNMSADTRHKSG